MCVFFSLLGCTNDWLIYSVANDISALFCVASRFEHFPRLAKNHVQVAARAPKACERIETVITTRSPNATLPPQTNAAVALRDHAEHRLVLAVHQLSGMGIRRESGWAAG